MNTIILGFKRMIGFVLYVLAFPLMLFQNFCLITIPYTIKDGIKEYKIHYLNSEDHEQ